MQSSGVQLKNEDVIDKLQESSSAGAAVSQLYYVQRSPFNIRPVAWQYPRYRD